MLVDSLQHLKPLDICLIDICLEIGDIRIPDCFFNSLKKSCCNVVKLLFVRLTDPSSTCLPNFVKLS